MRLTGTAKYSAPFILPFGQKLELTGTARYDVYHFSNAFLDNGEYYTGLKSRFLPTLAADWSIPFMRRDSDIMQIITPRARFVLMNHLTNANFINQDSSASILTDTTLFSDNRFYGYDVWSNGSFADYGLSYDIFNIDGRSIEMFVGQTYDFYKNENLDDNSGYRLHGSDYVGRLSINPFEWLSVYNRFRFDRDDMNLRHIETSAKIGTNNYITASYMYTIQPDASTMVENKLQEIRGGLGINITERLRANYNLTYNISEQFLQYRSIGLTYTHPCYAIMIKYNDDHSENLSGIRTGEQSFNIKFSLKLQGN
jgi:LPS-assembly protein